MYCRNCGKQIPNDANLCPYCGTSVWERSDSSATPPTVPHNDVPINNTSSAIPTSNPVVNNAPPITYNPSAANSQLPSFQMPAQFKNVNKEFILKNINTIFAVISVVLLFLPMLTVNAYEAGYSNRFTISGFDLAGGVVFNDSTTLDRNFFAWLMFVIPVLAVLSNYIKKLFPIKKVMLFVAPLICGICELFAKSSASSGMSVSLSAAMGFYIYLLVCILWLIIGYLQYRNIPLNRDSITSMLNKNQK